MKFNKNRSLILFSLFLILILNMSIVSASENLTLNNNLDENSLYESSNDSINFDENYQFSDDGGSNSFIASEDFISDYGGSNSFIASEDFISEENDSNNFTESEEESLLENNLNLINKNALSSSNLNSNFTSGSGIPISQTKIVLNSDNIYNKETDIKFLNDIATILTSYGYDVVVDENIGPNTHNTDIMGEYYDSCIFCIFGGVDSGMFVDMASNWYQYYLNLYNNRVVLGFTYTQRDLATETWIERAHDDDYSPSNFTGLAYPGTYLNKYGMDYVYGRNPSEMAYNFLNYAVNGLSIGLNNTLPGGNSSSNIKDTTIEILSPIYDDTSDVNLYIYLYDGANNLISGDVNLIFENKNFTVKTTNTDDLSILNLGQLNAGKYIISASFNENSSYSSSNSSYEFYILKSSNLTINTVDVKAGENEIIGFSLTDKNGNAINDTIFLHIFDVSGNDIYYGDLNLTKGKGTYLLENITKDCIINAIYYPESSVDEIPYTSANVYSTIRILDNSSQNQSDDNKTDNKTDYENVNIYLDYLNQTVLVSLRDSNNKSVANIQITVIVDNKSYILKTDSDGNLTISNVTNYVKVIYSYEKGLNISSSIIIKSIESIRKSSVIEYSDMNTTAVDVTSDGRVGKYFKVVLKDYNGVVLANKKIQIGFNANVYNRTTDENGSAKLQINLKNQGTYTFAVCFLGDDNYTGSFIVSKIIVTKQKPSLTVPNKSYSTSAKTKSLTATFKSAKGNLVHNKKITFTINGVTYTGTTNSKGVATVNVSLNKKGTYSFTAKFAGDNTYSAISVKASLKIA